MDSITHLAIGACMGEMLAGKELGKRALFWGALAHSIPDIDVVSAMWLSPSSELLAHRGFTHSFLFCGLVAPAFAMLAFYTHRQRAISLRKWLLFFGAVIGLHLLLDAFNNYGVGWLEPFSQYRVSFNSIYIVDPFFSLLPVLVAIILLVKRRGHAMRLKWIRIALGFSFLYLGYSLVNKAIVDKDVKASLEKQHIRYSSFFTTPAPLQTWLWYTVAVADSGYYVGYRSVFDRYDTIAFRFFPRNEALLNELGYTQECRNLVRFSRGMYTIEKRGNAIVFNDLRFGQVAGWYDPAGDFVFHYYPGNSTANSLVVQRGRFSGWNRKVLEALLRRIGGN